MRKEQKRREKAERKRILKEQGPGEGPSEEELAARYLALPEEDDAT